MIIFLTYYLLGTLFFLYTLYVELLEKTALAVEGKTEVDTMTQIALDAVEEQGALKVAAMTMLFQAALVFVWPAFVVIFWNQRRNRKSAPGKPMPSKRQSWRDLRHSLELTPESEARIAAELEAMIQGMDATQLEQLIDEAHWWSGDDAAMLGSPSPSREQIRQEIQGLITKVQGEQNGSGSEPN